MVLKNLENQDRNICSYFLPVMVEVGSRQNTLFEELRTQFVEWRNLHTNSNHYYNIVEKMILGVPMDALEYEAVDSYG
jgi:hypothetical protein